MAEAIFSFQFGDYKCTVFEDGIGEMPATDIFGTVPDDELQEALKNSPYDPQKIRLSTTQLLLDDGKKCILIDSGNGVGTGQCGEMLARLDESVGFEAIDMVVLTHAHADHIGGLMTADGEKTFPNAEYVMWQAEWDYYSSDERMKIERQRSQERYDYFSHYLLKIKPYLRLINEENNQVIEGICAIPCYGHTRYHVVYEIESQGQKMRHLGDAYLHPLCVSYPEWTFSFEFDDESAIATRYQLREALANSGILLSICHFPFPALGYIKQDAERFYWEAMD